MKQKKKKFKMWNKLLAFLGMFVMLTGCLAGTVQAGSYEAGKKGSLNLTVQQTDEDGKDNTADRCKVRALQGCGCCI